MHADGNRSSGALRRALTLVVLIAFMAAHAAVLDAAAPFADAARRATVALGFLLVTAFLAGKLAEDLGLPRITGYIILGLLAGPGGLGLVTSGDVEALRVIDDIAISLIALTAGAELRIAELRSRARSMGGIMASEMAAVLLVVAGGVLLFRDWLPLTTGQSFTVVAVIALIFGSVAVANSPSVAIAVINDTRSRGPVASTILGVTVLKDVVVILFFAVALSVGRTVLTPDQGFEVAFFARLLAELGGSIVVGALAGLVIALYLRRVRVHLVLFAIGLAFLNAWIASVLHLEVLLLSLAAGFFLENVSPVEAEPFVRALEANSLPLYALFFSLAGAGIHLAELAQLWPIALGFVLLRGLAVFGGTWVGATLTAAEPEVRRYAWLGFISQAGVTLGMVTIAARVFPDWGVELRTLFVAIVAIHELIGPVLLQKGLARAGEVGRRDATSDAAAGRVVTAGAPP